MFGFFFKKIHLCNIHTGVKFDAVRFKSFLFCVDVASSAIAIFSPSFVYRYVFFFLGSMHIFDQIHLLVRLPYAIFEYSKFDV